MSRFKDLYGSSSDSDSQTQSGPVQRGRVRETQRFAQIKAKQIQQADTVEIIITNKNKPKQQKLKQLQQSVSLELQANNYPQNTSVNANQKFIREHIKPVQQQMQHFLDKMEQTKSERKKFINALITSSKDLEKVVQKIEQLQFEELKNKNSQIKRNKFQKSNNENVQFKLRSMEELQTKIKVHLSNLMKQHEKTIQLMVQSRKDMQRTFQKVKFLFLDLKGVDFYDEESQKFQEFGIGQIYKILQKGDQIFQQVTSFIK